MRLKLAGGDRLKGSGVFAPWRARTLVHYSCAGGRVARSLRAIRWAAHTSDPTHAEHEPSINAQSQRDHWEATRWLAQDIEGPLRSAYAPPRGSRMVGGASKNRVEQCQALVAQ